MVLLKFVAELTIHWQHKWKQWHLSHVGWQKTPALALPNRINYLKCHFYRKGNILFLTFVFSPIALSFILLSIPTRQNMVVHAGGTAKGSSISIQDFCKYRHTNTLHSSGTKPHNAHLLCNGSTTIRSFASADIFSGFSQVLIVIEPSNT